MRLVTNSCCWLRDRHTRVPGRHKCSAACRLSEPQPQPTSSSRIPGSRPSLRQIRSSLARLPPRTRVDLPGCLVVARGVGHRLVQDERSRTRSTGRSGGRSRPGHGPGCAASRSAWPGSTGRSAAGRGRRDGLRQQGTAVSFCRRLSPAFAVPASVGAGTGTAACCATRQSCASRAGLRQTRRPSEFGRHRARRVRR